MQGSVLRGLKELDKKLEELDTEVKLLSSLNPTNLKEIQAAVIAGRIALPPIYGSHAERGNRLIVEAGNLLIPADVKTFLDGDLAALYERAIADVRLRASLLTKLGEPDFGQMARKAYPVTPANSLAAARIAAAQMPTQDRDPVMVTFDQMKRYFQEGLNALGKRFKGWEIEEAKNGQFSTLAVSGVFRIPSGPRNASQVPQIFAHEAGVHGWRGKNGRGQRIGLWLSGFPNNTGTEEGLAAIVERKIAEMMGRDPNEVTWRHAVRCVAVAEAEGKSLPELFAFLKEGLGVPAALAWDTAFRVKRGTDFKSKEEEGDALPKDAEYWSGFSLVSGALEENPDNLRLLYTGRVTVEGLGLVRRCLDAKLVKYRAVPNLDDAVWSRPLIVAA